MINNPQYKILAGQIADLFCESSEQKAICIASIKAKIINSFSDNTFQHFLENIQQGRYYLLKYSNWHADQNNCRSMKIDVRLTDVITGAQTSGYWNYTANDCGSNQYRFQDLNSLINKFGYTLLDPPIVSKNNVDITKERLVYNPRAVSYGIVFTPNSIPGAPPQIVPNNPSVPITANKENIVQAGSFDDILNLLTNPIVLIGVILAGYYIFKK